MKDDERKSLNWHSSDDEDADIYLDALRGKRVIRYSLIGIAIVISLILTYIFL